MNQPRRRRRKKKPETIQLSIELERAIFELSAMRNPEMISKLLLVCYRVKIWIESYLYESLHLKTHNIRSILDALLLKSVDFRSTVVKTLVISLNDAGLVHQIIELLPGLENIAYWAQPDALPLGFILGRIGGLRRISIPSLKCLRTDAGDDPKPGAVRRYVRSIDYSWQSTITHLDITYHWAIVDKSLPSLLHPTLFPNLRNLYLRFWSRDSILPVLLALLEECTQLEKIFLLVANDMHRALRFLEINGVSNDRIELTSYVSDAEFWKERVLMA